MLFHTFFFWVGMLKAIHLSWGVLTPSFPSANGSRKPFWTLILFRVQRAPVFQTDTPGTGLCPTWRCLSGADECNARIRIISPSPKLPVFGGVLHVQMESIKSTSLSWMNHAFLNIFKHILREFGPIWVKLFPDDILLQVKVHSSEFECSYGFQHLAPQFENMSQRDIFPWDVLHHISFIGMEIVIICRLSQL